MDIETLQLETEERMEKALSSLDRDFGKLRTGRPAARNFSFIIVWSCMDIAFLTGMPAAL